MQQDGLEAALAATEDAVEAAQREAAAAVRELKKARGAAAAGTTRELRRALSAAAEAAHSLAQAAKEAEASWSFDETAHLAGGDYTRELLATAREAGLAMVEDDGRLLSYPSLVRLLPADAALEIDKRRERRLRPSVVVAALAAAQSRPPKGKPAALLEALLFDEVELIGRYSLLQRGRSYAESARWYGAAREDPDAPLVTVLALTDDFEAAVLVGKDDRGKVPTRLRDKQTPEWAETAVLAEKGIRALERELLLLSAPDSAEFDRAYATLRALHAAAYDGEPPDVPGLERLGATRMRQYVRAWINAWDLVRLDPSHVPDPEVVSVPSSYAEDEALEQG